MVVVSDIDMAELYVVPDVHVGESPFVVYLITVAPDEDNVTDLLVV